MSDRGREQQAAEKLMVIGQSLTAIGTAIISLVISVFVLVCICLCFWAMLQPS